MIEFIIHKVIYFISSIMWNIENDYSKKYLFLESILKFIERILDDTKYEIIVISSICFKVNNFDTQYAKFTLIHKEIEKISDIKILEYSGSYHYIMSSLKGDTSSIRYNRSRILKNKRNKKHNDTYYLISTSIPNYLIKYFSIDEIKNRTYKNGSLSFYTNDNNLVEKCLYSLDSRYFNLREIVIEYPDVLNIYRRRYLTIEAQ